MELITHPATGEVLDMSAPKSEVAKWKIDVWELKSWLRQLDSVLDDELMRRMDESAKWTISSHGYTVSAPSPGPGIEWNPEQLGTVLDELMDEGVINKEAADSALEITLLYKPKQRGIDAIKKLGPEIAQRLDACATQVEKHRRVQVKPRSRA